MFKCDAHVIWFAKYLLQYVHEIGRFLGLPFFTFGGFGATINSLQGLASIESLEFNLGLTSILAATLKLSLEDSNTSALEEDLDFFLFGVGLFSIPT